MKVSSVLLSTLTSRSRLPSGDYSTSIECGLTLIYRKSLRGDGSWLTRISLGSRKSVIVVIGFAKDAAGSAGLSYTMAVEQALGVARDYRDRALPDGCFGIPLSQAVEDYFSERVDATRPNARRSGSVERERSRLVGTLEAPSRLGDLPLHQLREVDVEQWRAHLPKDKRVKDDKIISDLRSVLMFAWQAYPERIPSALARIAQRTLKPAKG